MEHNIGAVLDRPAESRGSGGVIHNHWHAAGMSHLGYVYKYQEYLADLMLAMRLDNL